MIDNSKTEYYSFFMQRLLPSSFLMVLLKKYFFQLILKYEYYVILKRRNIHRFYSINLDLLLKMDI
jgi:hypothetical protein